METPHFPAATQHELETVLGPKVQVANPLDYHTYIWGDAEASRRCFAGMIGAGFEASILILDFPRADRCQAQDWEVTLGAFIAAHNAAAPAPGSVRMVVSALPETMPESIAARLLDAGIVAVAGLAEALNAIAAAARIGAVWALPPAPALPEPTALADGVSATWDEAQCKAALQEFAMPVPRSQVVTLAEVEAYCIDETEHLPIDFPLVLKIVGAKLTHKTELGGVVLGITSRARLLTEAQRLAPLGEALLIEQMVGGAVAELIVGVTRDPQFGLFLTLGAGGIFVELLRQAEQVLLPATRAEIAAALSRLPFYPVLAGYRGRPGCDMPALLDAIEGVARFALAHAERLEELEVNPLLALPRGAMAVDALIRIKEPKP